MAEELQKKEYITEKEARTVKELFRKNLKSYKEKDASVSDREWMEEMFKRELDGIISPEKAKRICHEARPTNAATHHQRLQPHCQAL